MFDDIDYKSIIKYIDTKLLIYINNDQVGGSMFSSMFINGKLYSKNPNKLLFNMINNVVILFGSLFGISEEWINKNIIPIINYIKPIFERIWGDEKSETATYLLFILTIAKYFQIILPSIFSILQIPEEDQPYIKETLSSIIEFTNILALTIITINIIFNSCVQNIEKIIKSKFSLIEITFKRSFNTIQSKIANLFKSKGKKLPVSFVVDEQGNTISSITTIKDYSILTILGGSAGVNNIIQITIQIVKKYLNGDNLNKLIGELYSSYNFSNKSKLSKKSQDFIFNKQTGNIEPTVSINKTVWLTYKKKIKMVCKGMKITYFEANGSEINSISYFNAKPFHTAIILAWMETQTIPKPQNNFSAKDYIATDPNLDKKILDKTCEQIYGSNYSQTQCSEYYLSILGNSPTGILKILSTNVNLSELIDKSNKKIQYEILKTLGFKKNYLGQISPYNEWVNNLSQEKKHEYSKYLNNQVKYILEKIII